MIKDKRKSKEFKELISAKMKKYWLDKKNEDNSFYQESKEIYKQIGQLVKQIVPLMKKRFIDRLEIDAKNWTWNERSLELARNTEGEFC